MGDILKRSLGFGIGALALIAAAFVAAPATSAVPVAKTGEVGHAMQVNDGVVDPTMGKACARTEFKTALIKKACEKGGQSQAKKAMRDFMKRAKKASKEKVTCKSCHSKTSGDYPLTKDGLAKYNKYKKAM